MGKHNVRLKINRFIKYTLPLSNDYVVEVEAETQSEAIDIVNGLMRDVYDYTDEECVRLGVENNELAKFVWDDTSEDLHGDPEHVSELIETDVDEWFSVESFEG